MVISIDLTRILDLDKNFDGYKLIFPISGLFVLGHCKKMSENFETELIETKNGHFSLYQPILLLVDH